MKACDLTTTHKVWACPDTDDARHVAIMMRDHNVRSIPILDDDGRLEGIVTERDLVTRMIALGRSFETPIREMMTAPAIAVHPDTPMAEIESIMREHRIRHLPVVDDDRRLMGFVSISDMIRHCHDPKLEHELIGVLEAVRAPGKPAL